MGETDTLSKCMTVNFTEDGRTMSTKSHTSDSVKYKVRAAKNYHDCINNLCLHEFNKKQNKTNKGEHIDGCYDCNH